MTAKDVQTILTMESHGGGFTKALAVLASHADGINLELIKKTWPGYWEQYSKMAKRIQVEKSAL